ncbi:MAG TPA: SDR family oxidoreductase [Novosphingobium sp.]|nr:SDR family oxidoreductase [Novosphingobium sp.]
MVAGASTGIGRATALRLASEGAKVVVGSPPRERDLLDMLVEEIRAEGGEASAAACDASDDASMAAFMEAGVAAFGGIDALHANFADLSLILSDTDALSVSDELFDKVMDVNLKGMLRAIRHAVPHLLERGGAAVICTSSGAAIQGAPSMPCYAMSKSGLHGLIRHVASRWGKDNIRANAVLPGFVITPEKQHLVSPEMAEQVLATCRSPRLGKPEDIAAIVAFLASADGEWINGQCLTVDGGMLLGR